MKLASTLLLLVSLVVFSSCTKQADTIVNSPSSVSQKSVFVDPVNGNDNNTGREISSPFKTLKRASAFAVTNDTVLIKGGIYTGFKDEIEKSYSEIGYIYVKPYAGQSVVLDGTGASFAEGEAILTIKNSHHIEIIGLEIRNNIHGAGISVLSEDKYCDHISIKNCTIHDVNAAGIYAGSSFFTVSGCEIYNTCLNNLNRALGDNGKWHSAIETYFKYNYSLYHAEYIWTTAEISNNKIHHNWGDGVKITRTSECKITDNKIYNNYNCGIKLDNSKDALIFNNYIYTTNDDYNRVTSGYSRPMEGFVFCNERNDFLGNPITENVSVYNNLFVRTSAPFRWYYDATNNIIYNTYKDVRIAFNTTYNTIGKETFALDAVFGSRINPSGNEFRNNIIFKPAYNSAQQNYFTSSGDYQQYWSISNNCFASGDIPGYLFQSNISGDPAFSNASSNSPEGFKIAPGSICYATGSMIASIQNDYFLNPRSPNPSIGFFELMR